MAADPARDEAAPNLGGRPTTYTAEIGTRICEQIMEGESLRAICLAAGMPSRGQVLRWLAAEPEFRQLYRQARLLACELLADELLEIADDATQDWKNSDKGERVIDREVVQRSKLRIDTRQWMLSKMMPRAYGARVESPLLPHEAPPGTPAGAGGEPIAVVRTLSTQQRKAVAMALQQKFALEQQAHG